MYRCSSEASARVDAGSTPDSARTPRPGHNRGMHRLLTFTVAALLACSGLAACKESDSATSNLPRPSAAFCKAAAKYDKRVQKAKLAEQIQLVSAIAEHAPKDIASDARMFLDALQRRERGDKSVVDNPRVKTAVGNVNRRAGQDCGWYERQGM